MLQIEITKSRSYILKFIESTRFMASSLSNIVNNLSEEIHRIKCKYGHDDKNCETCEVKYKYWDCFLEYTKFKDNLTEYKCLICNKNLQKKKIDDKSNGRFFKTYKVWNYDSNNFYFIVALWKGVCFFGEYVDYCEKFNKTSLPVKEDFYRYLNMEDITGADLHLHNYTQNVFVKVLKQKY